jgi:transposase
MPEEKKSRPGRKKIEIQPEVKAEIERLKPFYGTREIAKRVGLSRKLVRQALKAIQPKSEEHEASNHSQSLLDPFREKIKALVEEGLSANRILREIRGKDPKTGFQGGKTILTDYVRELRAQIAPVSTKKKRRRFETLIGIEAQVDWSPMWVSIGGSLVLVHVLGVLLCWSRKLYVGIFRDERQSTLLEGLLEALEYFQGCTERLVLDNMATAVLGRIGPNHKPLWHPRFLEFAKHMGFDPFACMPGDPDRKGKKEKTFRLIYDDCFKGTKFLSWADALEYRWTWLDKTPKAANLRVHGTTGRIPNEAWEEEKKFLTALPGSRFAVHQDEARDVDADSTISIGQTSYTVPHYLANTTVAVRLHAHHFQVVDRQGRVAFSRLYVEASEKGTLKIDPTHYEGLKRRPRDRTARRLDESFVARFPRLAPLVDGLKIRMKTLAPLHLRELIRLTERFGEPAFLEAALRAQEYRRFDAVAVRTILEKAHPIAEGEIALEPLARGTGPVILGEVETPSLDDYGKLDRAPPSEEGPRGS